MLLYGMCSHTSPVGEGLLFGCASLALCPLDETVHSLIPARIARRSRSGGCYCMGCVLTPLLWVRGYCLDVLHSRFVRWTKPFTHSFLLGSLADLSRSKSQLIAENAL